MKLATLPLLWPRWRVLVFSAGGVLFAVLLTEAFRAFASELDYAEVLRVTRNTAWQPLVGASAAAMVSYLALSGYDWTALRLIDVRLPWPSVLQTSFVAYAVGNCMGVGVLTGGAVRMRMYGSAGLDAAAISQVMVFNALTFAWGVVTVGAAGLFVGAYEVAATLGLSPAVLRVLAGVILTLGAALCTWLGRGRQIQLGATAVRLPDARTALRLLVITGLDIVASALVLWLLLPAGSVPFAGFVGCYAIATALGVISHVPGGLGVFEALMFATLRGTVASEDLAGALVLYRLVYYVAPLAIALAMLAASELRRGFARPMWRAASGVAPLLLAAYTIVMGVMLLVSGATPMTREAVSLLSLSVPLPIVEASHFLGSIAGLALLLVAHGMLQRLDAAWWAGIGIALVSLVLAFPKGIAWSEAGLLAMLVFALASSRKQFTRRASALTEAFSPGWLVAVGVILVAITGLMWFVYRDVEYSHELWWQFEFDAHAPRSLRAMLGVDVLALFLAVRLLLRPPPPPLTLPDEAALIRARTIIDTQGSADACLALMGDKHLLFAPNEDAFLMFGVRGRSWVNLFDPVGAVDAWPGLVWQFIARARDAGGRASFYQVRAEHLALYLDTGMRVLKLGEYAHVPLATFSLQGKARANLRSGVNRAEREGLHFSVLPPAEVPAMLPTLRAISDAWLSEHKAAEKGFSLGTFDESYVARLPVAMVLRNDEPVAFATLMTTAEHSEVSVDLMRHLPGAPRGTMDFLFAQLMLHFKAAGYARFGLGMAPLSGMATHPLAPNWHRFGRLLFAHGEHFYNFQGLRAFKDKFAPEWEARYLACPGGVAPLLVLADVAALIGGGFKGVFAK